LNLPQIAHVERVVPQRRRVDETHSAPMQRRARPLALVIALRSPICVSVG